MNDNGCKNIFSNWDYTLDKYEKLCNTIVLSKYVCVPIAGYLQLEHGKNKNYIIMRHDIDRSPQRAVEVAKVEHKCGISGTYYFRAQRGTFAPDIIDTIASLGHEIGFHYETVDKCKGNLEAASELFKKELAEFRKRYVIKTVCAHGNPLTKYDNKDIWKTLKLVDVGLLGEAFLALDFNKFAYFSDSGRTWLKNPSQKMQGKDDVKTAFEYMRPKCTDDVINIIKDGKLPNICILTHCERWSKDIISFSSRYLFDCACSWGKVAIYSYRKVNRQ